ncbi:pilus assembly protein TadG-related protein [Sphaerimonospora cavernae]|uniref:Pilus assembly protein TadG-related protein n=1 Tax=Sphaerimonospora cavernae TaxID=1740611 RepID=A0ABV6U9N9_9ACTN
MSVFVVIFSAAVFLLAGLLVDGGSAINARLKAADIAEQAARGAADQIDQEILRTTGEIRLLSAGGDLCGRAEEIVGAHQANGVRMTRCEAGGQTEVTVGVAVHWDAYFLGVLGFNGSDMEAAATAAPSTGTAALARTSGGLNVGEG